MISVYLRTLGFTREQFSDELIYYGDDRWAAQLAISEHLGQTKPDRQIIWHEEGRKCVSGTIPPREGRLILLGYPFGRYT